MYRRLARWPAVQRCASLRCYDQPAEMMAQNLGDILSAIESALRNPTPKTWVGVAVFFFVLWFIFFRRR